MLIFISVYIKKYFKVFKFRGKMSVNNCSDHTLEFYKFIFESSLDAILLTRTDGTIFYANPASEELFGYTQKEICDLGRIGIVDTKDPNLKIMLDERARLGKSKGELTLIKKDNSRFPAEVSTNIFKDKNCKINTFMTIRDISQRKKAEESLKESEERYHSLFDNNHATMLLINPNNGNIIDANPAATHFYGYNYDELVKMNINEINVLSEEEIHAKMQKSVSSQQNHFLFKHQLANSEIRDVDVYSGKIVIGGEKLLYSIVHDVTDRVIAQNKLKESNEELERFAYVSSHDLQEPLRMVTSFTQLLERRYKGRLDADADEYIEFIVDGAKHMKLLIDDLLMLSRLNTLPRENEFVNLETVLNTVLLNLQISIEENNVQITHDPLPHCIWRCIQESSGFPKPDI